jgi:hypothetical protein
MGTGQAPPDPEVVFVNRVPVQGLKFVTGQFNPVDQQQNLPLESTQNGNIFTDRFNPQLSWYLPGYQLAPDIDAGFSFSAGAKGIDASGNPYYQAAITLTVDKIEPPDVTAYRTANPSQQLQEIPLTSLTATLATSANDPQTGSVQQIVYNAAVAADANGNLTLTFNTLLGAQVLVAYSNLQSGGATIAFSAQFEVWRVLSIAQPPIDQPPIDRPPIDRPPIDRPPIGVIQRPPIQRPIGIGVGRPPILPKLEIEGGPVRPIFPIRPIPTPTPTPPQTTYTTASDPFTLSFSLDQKYAAPGYARSYTITDSNGVRPIININDLKNFDVTQSEYTQFTALKNISSQFPSFSRLYIGGLSRTIVAIPAAYGIVRSKDGTGAVCEALLDSTAGGSGAAKFQFAFVLGPVVSPFDLFALQAALAANPQSQNCTLTLPQVLDTSQPMSLATPFQSSVSYTAGQLPSTFQLDVVISDGSVAGSAVANANLFLKQLSPTVATYLSGSFGVLLDDAYPHPVIASVVLSLHDTSGSDDEISSIVAADGSSIELVNPSPLDLEVSRYAIVSGNSAPPETLNQKLPSQQSITLSDKATSSSPVLLVDRTLALEDPFTKEALQRYVSFITQDVQNVNYQIGVVAPGVDFVALGIAEIDIVITIPSLPSVTVPGSTLTALNSESNTVITLPIQNAITTLPAVIAFTVKAAAATETAVQFTENNDFVDQPVYVLQASSIPPFAAIPLQS